MLDVYGAASDVGLNCATGLNIGGGNSTRGADSSHSATTILMAGRDFKMFFLGGTTLHNKNEFRTNAAVRNFVSMSRNCQTFRASHKRTDAQAHKQNAVPSLFGNIGASNAPVRADNE